MGWGMLPRFFASIDLIAAGVLSADDLRFITDAAMAHVSPAVLRGDSPTSLEPSYSRIHYELLDGIGVSSYVPLLEELYKEQLLSIAQRLTGLRLLTSPDPVNGVNVNV